ncbi:AMME syndrome candidate gene 1 protein [Talaromyces islandicus]|uniref:AMME syndrome candidate gene 1 protein n=1 Tax=Talaromyces islandicus TaxID=28573 RepID=A0A0U1LSC8_TALIS|nr:AMME syndrome candidate gene 1 protein [Talaromyces islandicus]
MASPAQCFYCFETLASSYDNEEPPSLAAIEESWWHFNQAKSDKAAISGGNDNLENNNEGINVEQPPNTKRPSISRLQEQGTSSDSSSVSTTPSTLSIHSSQSVLSNTTNVTIPGESPGYQRSKLSNQPYPLFVTWDLISRHGHKSLRGCIGTFEAQELSKGLKNYALISALEDTRFSPIPSSQIPSLSCSLTLLSDFEPCEDAMDWELGVHGLRISFIHRSRRYGATYLPDVAVEQGWTKEETVESLMRKAGWDSSVARRLLKGSSGNPWDEVSDFKATRYQGLKASATYGEWQEWRQWVQADKSRIELLQL